MMQYKFEIKPKLEKKLKKIEKKDPVMFKAVRDKIEEITENPRHYKPLRYDMKGLRRVHLEKSFVLVFEIDEEEKMVRFLDLGHHDEIYRKK
ncbi:MAG: type II toxin-antitoxin system mRNA interferase toxin, RelE/StbE family [Methanophagales archaeon]|nr:type II toxin-antitoxin system mRNA interferase toxin, RelE/StbE family [Methanophagales archaeon]